MEQATDISSERTIIATSDPHEYKLIPGVSDDTIGDGAASGGTRLVGTTRKDSGPSYTLVLSKIVARVDTAGPGSGVFTNTNCPDQFGECRP
jgi:hypothetical protein